MKVNAVKAFIIASLIIIILYILGLFLPIILNTKDSKISNYFPVKTACYLDKKIIFLSV